MSEIMLNYDAVKKAEIISSPCPHLVVKDFIRPESLAHLVPLLPHISSGGSYPPEALPLAPPLKAMIEDFQGETLKKIISEKFNISVEDAPSMLTLRGKTREKDGRIHRDSKAKLVTILLYLNPLDKGWGKEGCLRFTHGPDDIEDYASEIPPIGGTLVVFPNGDTTWHGHRQYIGPRYTIQLNYMAAGYKAKKELMRHKLSALWKSLPFAA